MHIKPIHSKFVRFIYRTYLCWKIKKSGLFDVRFYLSQLSSNASEAVSHPIRHYLDYGEAAGYLPHPLFDPSWYRDQYPDIAEGSISPLAHFLSYGALEQRQPHPLFSTSTFLSSLPSDVLLERKDLNPVVRYQKFALEENSRPHELFDPAFYLETNPDVLSAKVNPLIHYLKTGFSELRSPNPEFDEKWYRDRYRNEIKQGESGLVFHVKHGAARNYETSLAAIQGRSSGDEAGSKRQKILVVAHAAGERFFGAERSLLDVLSVIDTNIFSVVLALPNPSALYVDQVRPYFDEVVIYKARWWKNAEDQDASLVSYFSDLIASYSIDLLYGNTIMVREAFTAARERGIPSIRHVRELISDDKELQNFIGLPPEQIVEEVVLSSNAIIANSNATLEIYNDAQSAYLVHNAVDVDELDIGFRDTENSDLRVGMLSSNSQKKGLLGLCTLAEAAAERGLQIEFMAFGPTTPLSEALKGRASEVKKIPNLHFMGYIEKSVDAISQVDVVINLSEFSESFGRTLAEGMAARRPVVGYDHGAIPSVIGTSGAGRIIPFLQPTKALDYLEELMADRQKLYSAGQLGRARAKELFSRGALKKKINFIFADVIQKYGTKKLNVEPKQADAAFFSHGEDDEDSLPTVTAIIPNYNYSQFLEERITSVLNQTRLPDEVLFLDDKSSDNSIERATEIFEKYANGIPYKIITNEENLGVYKQWVKGISLASSDWLWIAEADDSCDAEFLSVLLSKASPKFNIVFCQSRKINSEGRVLSDNNKAHTDALSLSKWSSDYKENGTQEVLSSIGFRNTIPNASAVIFRKSAVGDVKSLLASSNYAGDWLLYAHLLVTGGIAYVSEVLNNFRRHSSSATASNMNSEDYLLEIMRVRNFINSHFPILPRHIKIQDCFIDRDYKIRGVKRNSKSSIVSVLHKKSRELTQHRKMFGFITTNNGSHNGGSEVLWKESALNFLRDGHSVVVLIKKWDPLPEFLNELFHLGAKILFKEDDGFTEFLKCRPDLTIVSIGDQDEGIQYYGQLSDADIPYVIVNQLTKEQRFWPVRVRTKAQVRHGYMNAKKVFFTCKNNQKIMEDRIGKPMPHGDIHFNPYHIDRSVVTEWPEIMNGPSIAIPSKLLFIHKGQDLLLDIASYKKFEEFSHWTFNFYGDGPDRGALEHRILSMGLKNFHVHGRVDDISEIWRSNQALLMPSRMEGLPIMLVSALLSQRVCIATNIGGASEVIDDGRTGFIIPQPEPGSILEALIRANQEINNWEQIGKTGRESILDYLPKDPAGNFIEKISELIK